MDSRQQFEIPVFVFRTSVILTIVHFCLMGECNSTNAADRVFPGATWESKKPSELNLSDELLDNVAKSLGGHGCVVKQGYMVKIWGEQEKRTDIFSSAKPVLSTLLMFAMKEGKITSFDQPVSEFGWELSPKDRGMTIRHLTNMVGGYARPEEPGKAWAYNDYAIQLYQKTLFDRIFQSSPEEVFHDPSRFGALQLQDGFKFNPANRRMNASPRDFARIAWFWLNRGEWDGKQLLPREYFDENMRPQVPSDLPNSNDDKTNDYLKIGSYGGESNHFTKYGPGIYGFNWWHNAIVPNSKESLTWPDAPKDAVMSQGFRGNSSVIIPSLDLVVVALNADWGPLRPGRVDAQQNQHLKAITAAGTPNR